MKKLVLTIFIISIVIGSVWYVNASSFLPNLRIGLGTSMKSVAGGVTATTGDTRVTIGGDTRITIGADTRTIP